MMMGECAVGMMLFGLIAGVLGLGLVASLIVLIWVVIGRLRHDAPPAPPRPAAP